MVSKSREGDYPEESTDPGDNVTDPKTFNSIWDEIEASHSPSNCHWKNIIFSMVDMIFVFDKNGKFIFHHSPEDEALYTEPRNFLGRRHTEVMPPEMNEPFDVAVERNRNGEVAEYQYSLEIDEDIRWFQVKLSPITLDGEYKGSVAVVRDVTSLKKAERAMRETEDKYRNLFENSIIGIYCTKPDGHILIANPALVNMLGYESFDELSGRNLEKNGFERENPRMKFKEMIERDGEIKGLESAWLRKDGSILYLRENARTVRDGKGNIVYYEGTMEDITERVKARETIMERETNFRAIAENANDGILITTGDGNIAYVNEKVIEMTGFSADDLVGHGYQMLLPPTELEKMKSRFERRMRGEAVPNQYEIQMVRKEKGPFSVEVTAAVTQWQRKPADLIIIRDITDRRQYEDELRKQMMKFQLDDGNLYLVQETVPALALDAFSDLLVVGFQGVVLSRRTREEVKDEIKGEYDFCWFAESGSRDTLLPDLDEIIKKMASYPQRNAVLIERLDYLISKNGFEKTLAFIQKLRETAYNNDIIIIISIDPKTLLERESALLEKEGREIIPLDKAWLPDKLFDILKFIHAHNRIGKRPSHTKTSKELGISKPTAGKRIRQLIGSGYVMEAIKGKSKVLELTPEGRQLFMN